MLSVAEGLEGSWSYQQVLSRGEELIKGRRYGYEERDRVPRMQNAESDVVDS